MKKLSILLSIMMLSFSLSACSNTIASTNDATTTTIATTTVAETSSETTAKATTEAETTTAPTNDEMTFEPLSIVTFEDKEVTYDHIPEKVVSLNLHTTENLLALGLEDKLIGTAYGNAEILPEFKDAYEKIEKLSEKYPSLEVLLGTGPDFVYGRSSAFGEKGVASVDTFIENDIMPYVSKATYTAGATMDDTYADFEFLGKLFAVEDKATEIIDTMKTQIADVEAKTSTADQRLKVFVYDFGTDDAFTCGQSLESDIIAKAGGDNLFSNIEKTWVSVSWEEVVEGNPDVIVINDYGDTSAEEKIKILKENPALEGVAAIQNDRFVVLPLPSVFTGIRNGDAIVYLAESFYPELFE